MPPKKRTSLALEPDLPTTAKKARGNVFRRSNRNSEGSVIPVPETSIPSGSQIPLLVQPTKPAAVSIPSGESGHSTIGESEDSGEFGRGEQSGELGLDQAEDLRKPGLLETQKSGQWRESGELHQPGQPGQEEIAKQHAQSKFDVNTFRDARFVCSDSETIPILEDAVDLEDYKIRLSYFWGHIFLLTRNLKSKERQDIFQATLPLFCHDSEMRTKLEAEFDICYRVFQKHFIRITEEYGRRWLNSDACSQFLQIESHARRQKKPKQFPIPEEPSSGQDLFQFQDWKGLSWSLTDAIKFWSPCLHAFETVPVSEGYIGWFATESDKVDVALRELSTVALELIRQFAVYEMRNPGGYSLEAHTIALRTVMPGILNERKYHLKGLHIYLGITPIRLTGVDVPRLLNHDLRPWAGHKDTGLSEDFEQGVAAYGNQNSPVGMHSRALGTREDALLDERLGEIDASVKRADEGLPAIDDVSAREYELVAQQAQEVEDRIQATFRETLEKDLQDDVYLAPTYNPSLEQLSVDKLRAPLILDGPAWTKRAQTYAKGNIWARQLMGQTDRALELRRLNVILVAAQHAINYLQEEERKFQEEIAQLEAGNAYLQEAWLKVQERIQQNKALEQERDHLAWESDSLQRSRVAAHEGGSSFSGFGGFSTDIGVPRFRPGMGIGNMTLGTHGAQSSAIRLAEDSAPGPLSLPASRHGLGFGIEFMRSTTPTASTTIPGQLKYSRTPSQPAIQASRFATPARPAGLGQNSYQAAQHDHSQQFGFTNPVPLYPAQANSPSNPKSTSAPYSDTLFDTPQRISSIVVDHTPSQQSVPAGETALSSPSPHAALPAVATKENQTDLDDGVDDEDLLFVTQSTEGEAMGQDHD